MNTKNLAIDASCSVLGCTLNSQLFFTTGSGTDKPENQIFLGYQQNIKLIFSAGFPDQIK